MSASQTSRDGRAALRASYPSGADRWTAVGVTTANLTMGSIPSITAWAVADMGAAVTTILHPAQIRTD
jgi:hypothetical protein